MQPVEKAVLDRFRVLLAERLQIHKMILFGSRARGDADPESDLDLFVVLDEEADAAAKEYVSQCAWEAGFEQGIVVVPVVFGRWEWEHGPERRSLLILAVEREGVPV
jgi:UTP:GlnB (protein PII) uridylyltransferase